MTKERSETPSLFYENKVLFGSNPTPRLVAAEFDGRRGVDCFFREGKTVRREKQPFRPFLLLSDPALLADVNGPLEIQPLNGEGALRYLLLAPDWRTLQATVKHLQKVYGKTPGDPTAPYAFASDPVHQHLLMTGQTFFKEMVLEDLVRMQIDLETVVTEGFEFPNAEREGDRIVAIGMAESQGWEQVLSAESLSEPEMIEAFVTVVRERDPDVLEGHNLFNFDLCYLLVRAKRYGLRLNLGREGREARVRPSRLQIAERTIAYSRFDIYGRHVVDTLFLTQLYDVGSRELESYSLKEVARHFRLSRPDRVRIDPGRIAWYLREDPDRLKAYCLDDVRETRDLATLLSRSYFYQAQIFPYSYQNVILRGNATKINALFLREYVRRRQAVPLPPPAREFSGGYTDLFEQGVLFHVLNCDVQSLYPSLMLTFGHFPEADTLKIFASLLADLRVFRIRAKQSMQSAENEAEARKYDALQSTFKVLINSFYGYLGFPLGNFSDVDQAEQVTARGRDLIRKMVRWLSARGCRIIEIDTDGIYFVPPTDIRTPEAEEDLIEALSQDLPEGVRLELSGRYRAMFSYKMKNYVLLTETGELIIKGSGLKSRGLERFQRTFMAELFHLMLTGRAKEAPALLERYCRELRRHQWEPAMFMKTETLQESLGVYREKIRSKKRNMSAAYELALRSDRPYQPGDSISYYVTGSKKNVKVFEACKLATQWHAENPDENTPYYEAKLMSLYDKFKPFVEGITDPIGKTVPRDPA